MKVLVLMSTYNGEKYIREQIDSILSQKGVEVRILVRDDGSKDGTREIVQDYAHSNKNIVLFTGKNIGFVKSFSRLVELGLKDDLSADFFAFADQDDIWYPEKLKTACDVLSQCDSNEPLLHQSNSMVVDAKGNSIKLFHESDLNNYGRGSALIHGSVQGCAMVFNKKAAEIYINNPPEKSWHDRWMFMICYYLGKTFYEHKPQFSYRVHGNNTLASSKMKRKDYYEKQLMGFIKDPLHLMMATEFYNKYKYSIKEGDKRLFKIYLSYRYNLLSKLNILVSSNFRYPFSRGKRLYIFKVVIGRV